MAVLAEKQIESKSAAVLPSIYSFNDVTQYLKAIYIYKRTKNPRLSLGSWSRKLGIKGSGTLSNIISGRRIPSPEILNKIRMDLELSEYQQIYFDALIASSEKNQNPVLKRMTRQLLVSEKTGEQYFEMEDHEFEIVADPIYMVLREAVKLDGFKNDPKWIAEHLNLIEVSEERIQSAFDSLLKVGLLRLEGDRYVQDDRHFKTASNKTSEALKCYYETSLDMNKRAIREVPKEERHFNSITFACNPEDLPELKEMVHAFSRNLMERFDRSAGTLVYQLHTQMIPHFTTQKISSEGSDEV